MPRSAVVLSVLLCVHTVGHAAPPTFWTDGSGDAVVDSSGECWRAQHGVSPAACGSQPAAPAAPADGDGDGVPDSDDRCPDTGAGVEVDEVGCALDSDGDGVVDASDRCPGTVAGAEVDAAGCVAVLTVDATLFGVDKVELDAKARERLEAFAVRLGQTRDVERVTVTGHTDDSGPASYNLTLSKRRAQAVADLLIANGVGGEAIVVRGAGETQPVADNATAAGRAQNRRVTIEVQ